MSDTLYFTKTLVQRWAKSLSASVEVNELAEDWLALHARVAALKDRAVAAEQHADQAEAQIVRLTGKAFEAEARVTRLAEALRQIQDCEEW